MAARSVNERAASSPMPAPSSGQTTGPANENVPNIATTPTLAQSQKRTSEPESLSAHSPCASRSARASARSWRVLQSPIGSAISTPARITSSSTGMGSA